MKKFYFLASLFAIALVACNDDDDEVVIKNGDYTPDSDAILLYEGSFNQNNADFTTFNEGAITADVFYKANGKKLGDTATDMMEVGDYYYIAVNNSNYVSMIDDDTYVEKASRALYQPRYLASDGNFLYVSTYGQKVYKLSLIDLSLVDSVAVGSYTEGLAIENNYLLAANSGYGAGNTVSVIDLSTFDLVQDVTVPANPTSLLATGTGKVFVKTTEYTADYSSATATISSIDVENNFAVATVTEASHMCLSANGNYVYFANCVPNYYTYTYQTSFFKYDLKNEAVSSDAVFANDSINTLLSSISLYMFNINPDNGEIFVGTSDYSTNSELYVIDKKGNSWVRYEDAGGVNVNKALFD